MALKQNGRLIFQMPIRHRAGLVAGDRANWGGSSRVNQAFGEGIVGNRGGVPDGHLHPSSWILPQKSDAMSAYAFDAVSLVDAPLDLLAGVNLDGSSSVVVNSPPSGVLLAGLASISGTDVVVDVSVSTPAAIGSGNLTSTESVTFAATGTLSAGVFVDGSTTLTFDLTGTIAAAVSLTGTGTTGSLTVDLATVTGSGLLVATTSASLSGELSLTDGRNLTGTLTMSLTGSGQADAEGFASAGGSLGLTATATLTAIGVISGSTVAENAELTVDAIWSRVLSNGLSAETTVVNTLKTAKQTFAVAAAG